jgi:hypothetical protein
MPSFMPSLMSFMPTKSSVLHVLHVYEGLRDTHTPPLWDEGRMKDGDAVTSHPSNDEEPPVGGPPGPGSGSVGDSHVSPCWAL